MERRRSRAAGRASPDGAAPRGDCSETGGRNGEREGVVVVVTGRFARVVPRSQATNEAVPRPDVACRFREAGGIPALPRRGVAGTVTVHLELRLWIRALEPGELGSVTRLEVETEVDSGGRPRRGRRAANGGDACSSASTAAQAMAVTTGAGRKHGRRPTGRNFAASPRGRAARSSRRSRCVSGELRRAHAVLLPF